MRITGLMICFLEFCLDLLGARRRMMPLREKKMRKRSFPQRSLTPAQTSGNLLGNALFEGLYKKTNLTLAGVVAIKLAREQKKHVQTGRYRIIATAKADKPIFKNRKSILVEKTNFTLDAASPEAAQQALKQMARRLKKEGFNGEIECQFIPSKEEGKLARQRSRKTRQSMKRSIISGENPATVERQRHLAEARAIFYDKTGKKYSPSTAKEFYDFVCSDLEFDHIRPLGQSMSKEDHYIRSLDENLQVLTTSIHRKKTTVENSTVS